MLDVILIVSSNEGGNVLKKDRKFSIPFYYMYLLILLNKIPTFYLLVQRTSIPFKVKLLNILVNPLTAVSLNIKMI